MKIRNSLVSNSSSSSFICNNRPIYEIAKDMFKMVVEDWDNFSKSRAKKILSNIKLACSFEEVQQGICGICFMSTNFFM